MVSLLKLKLKISRRPLKTLDGFDVEYYRDWPTCHSQDNAAARIRWRQMSIFYESFPAGYAVVQVLLRPCLNAFRSTILLEVAKLELSQML